MTKLLHLVKRGVFIDEFEIICKSSVEVVQHRLLRILQEKHFTQEKGTKKSETKNNVENRFSANSADSLRVYEHVPARVQDSRAAGDAAQGGNEQISQQIPRGKAAAFGSSAGFRGVAPR